MSWFKKVLNVIRSVWSRPLFRIVVVLLIALTVGFLGGRSALFGNDVDPSGGRIKLKPGPWGEVEYLPITIAAPRKLLRIQGTESDEILWYLTGETRASVSALLERLDVPQGVRTAITGSAVLSEHPQGVMMKPTCAMISGLGVPARRRLFEMMANEPTNNPNRWEFFTDFTKSFKKYGVSRSTLGLLEDVSVEYGRYTVTYAMACVYAGVDDDEEKVGLAKSLSQQNSMLVRIRIRPDTDIQALAAYWGRGMWTTDVEAILESVKNRPDGGVVNILEMLPPLAGALLHSYPTPHNFLAGPEVIKNCSWTAFNFFRDEPRPEFADEGYVLKTLTEDYLPVLSDPRFGDIAVFLTPDRRMAHVAVVIADDLYFTKNGDNPWHPWVFSNLRDMMEAFSFGLPEGQGLSIHYFRSKGY
jgi:hypothetical protein